MQKLIFDNSTLERIASSVVGLPVTMGPGGAMLDPGIVDLLDAEHAAARWMPNDERTGMLVLAAEACLDVMLLSEHLIDSKTRRRAMRAATVPVCKLMDVVNSLGKRTAAPH